MEVNMVEIRLVKQEEMNTAVQLADAVFREKDDVSMGVAFPYLFSAEFSKSYGAFENGKLLSFIGLQPSTIRIGSAELSVYSIGAVCTDPEARGLGYASQILEEIKAYMEAADTSLLLVSGTRSLYTRFGCREFGQIQQFTLNEESLSSLAPRDPSIYKIRKMMDGEWSSLQKIAAKRHTAYEQSASEIAVLTEAEPMACCENLNYQIFVAEQDQNPVAFLIVALKNESTPKKSPFVVEWAGPTAAVQELLAYVIRIHNLDKLEMSVSWHEKDLLLALQSVPGKKQRNEGTVYIVQPERLIEQLRPYLIDLHPEIGAQLQAVSHSYRQVTLRLHGFTDLTIELEEWISLLFGPMPELEANKAWKEALALLFPLPFPYTNGLNFV
jgi:predicted acetyltransferase